MHPFIRFCSDAGTETFSIIIGVYVTDDWPGSLMAPSISRQRGYAKILKNEASVCPGRRRAAAIPSFRGHRRTATSQPSRLGNKEHPISTSFRTSTSARP